MFRLEHIGRANEDLDCQRLQQIARMHPSKYINNTHILDEPKQLASEKFTFVNNWNCPEIDPSTYRLFGRKKPAKEATCVFINHVRACIDPLDIRERESDDVQNNMFSHSEWQSATESTRRKLNNKVEEPQHFLFFKGAVYECTYNEDMKFSQS